MSSVESWADKVRRGDPIPLALAAVLSAATPLVRVGMWRRLRRTPTRVDARVISFGNITAGGTGKTPAVIERAQQEIEAGHRVAILTRGYGGARTREPLAWQASADGENAAERIGDEPALIARRVPGALIVRAANRAAGARVAVEEYGCDTLIMDDGYQHVALARDENVLLIDATNPWGNGHLIPRGILREPLTAVQRATSIMLTRCEQVRDVDSLAGQIEELTPGTPVRKTRHAPCSLWRIADGAERPLHTLCGQRVTAVCAIANPEAFVHTLVSLGAVVDKLMAFPDHAAIPEEAVPRAGMVVTTEKDAVRMTGMDDNVLALGISLADL